MGRAGICPVCGKTNEKDTLVNRAGNTGKTGSREAKRPTLLVAMFGVEYTGGGQGWKSDHLEPFFVWAADFI